MSDHQHWKKNQTFISTNQTFLCALRPFTASLNILPFYLAIIYTEQQGSLFNVTNKFLTEINDMFFKITNFEEFSNPLDLTSADKLSFIMLSVILLLSMKCDFWKLETFH